LYSKFHDRFRQAFTLLLIPLLGYYAARGYSMVISAIYAAAQVGHSNVQTCEEIQIVSLNSQA
jgi:hypothetical protein